MIGPGKATTKRLRNSLIFTGSASRSEFWWFAALCTAILVGLHLVEAQVWDWDLKGGTAADIFTSTFKIVAILPLLAVATRRVQDVGLHGALVFAPAIAVFVHQETRSIMFDWLRINELRVGHPESRAIQSLPNISNIILVGSYLALIVTLILPKDFFAKHRRNPSQT